MHSILVVFLRCRYVEFQLVPVRKLDGRLDLVWKGWLCGYSIFPISDIFGPLTNRFCHSFEDLMILNKSSLR